MKRKLILFFILLLIFFWVAMLAFVLLAHLHNNNQLPQPAVPAAAQVYAAQTTLSPINFDDICIAALEETLARFSVSVAVC